MERVFQRLRDADENLEGTGNYRAWADHTEYGIGFCDESTSKLTTNIIAENMYSRVKSEGRQFKLIKEICDHRSDQNAISKRFRFTVSKNVNNTPKMTTVRWKLQVERKYGSLQWLDIRDIKASQHLELSEYALTKYINKDP